MARKKPDNAQQQEEKKRGNSLLEWVKSLAIALVLFFFIRSFILHTFVIISGSMEDTLLNGDLLLVNRAAVGSRIPGTSIRIPGYSEPKRGDVLVFDPHHEDDLKLVKRLVGLPGDTLQMIEKSLFLNGRALDESYVKHIDGSPDLNDPIMRWQEDYLLPDANGNGYRPTRDDWGPIVVPEGYYFMLGDNRDASYDSRYWGLLEQWRIEGRVAFIYFSYDRESLKPNPFLKEIRWGRIGDRVR
jgi:signal peptidase I